MAASKRTTAAPGERLHFAHYDYGGGLVYLAEGACSPASCRCEEIHVDALLARQDLLARLSMRDLRRVKRFAALRRQVRERIARAIAAAGPIVKRRRNTLTQRPRFHYQGAHDHGNTTVRPA